MARVPESSRVRSVGVAALDGQARSTAQRAGQAVEETGRATQRAIAAATKFGTDLRRRRQQAEDDGFTSSVTTKARSRFQEVFLESQNQATEGAEDFASSFQKRLDQETEALIEAARAAGGRPSTRAIQDTRNRLQLLGAAFTGQAATFENNARIAKLSRDLTGGLDDLTRQAFDDPERRPELLDAADEGIDAAASFLPAADLDPLRARARSAITLASVNGVIDRDPGLAAEMLEAGDFDEGLEAGRKTALIASAKTAERLEEEALARELAANRRELRRDADAAIAKLRGGQLVAELAALESRAEAHEDGETRAALRHAEDDRLFMRGFAQRPPAAQSALIAAMEDGPELKPIETRRLAAMKAQAAVTERALARDPLAYAQSSGVIEEPADLTDLAPEALRARLRQAETVKEQYGLATLRLLRPGEALALAVQIGKGAPEKLRAKAEELAELPDEIRQTLVEKIGPKLPPDARTALDLTFETEGVGVTDQEALVGQAVAALLQGAPLEAVQRGLRERGVDPAEFGAVPDARAFDETFVTEGPDGQVRVFGTKDGNLENLGLFGQRRGAITRAETMRGLGPDNAFRDLVPAEGEREPLRPLTFEFGAAAELPKQIIGGLFDAAQNVIDPFDPSGERRLPEIAPAKTPAGRIARGAAQFLVGFIPAVRALKVLGTAAKLAKGARSLKAGEKSARLIGQVLETEVAAVIAGQAVLDPFEDRLSNFVEEFPQFRNPITAFLAADPDDSEAEARFKLAVEDLAVGLGAAFVPIVKALRERGVQELPPAIDTERFVKVSKPDFDPASGRQVLHDVDDVNEILRRATQAREPFEQSLWGISEDLGMGTSFESTRVKEAARLGEKLEDRPINTLGDYLGGRIVVDTPADLRAAVKRIGQEFKILNHDNFLMTPRETGYRAVHVQVKLESGISAEIQIIPTPVKKVSNDQRKVFEEWRNANLTRDERAKLKQTLKRTNEDFEAAFDRWMEGKPPQ